MRLISHCTEQVTAYQYAAHLGLLSFQLPYKVKPYIITGIITGISPLLSIIRYSLLIL
jgi:hypothetical protein